jgi:hypothetical protein
LLEAPLEVLIWYGCEVCCHILLNFSPWKKIFKLNLETLEESELKWSKIWRGLWLGDGWNFVLCQKELHCEEGVTVCIVMV